MVSSSYLVGDRFNILASASLSIRAICPNMERCHKWIIADLVRNVELVSLTSLFSTNMAISETKGQGWKVIRTQ